LKALLQRVTGAGVSVNGDTIGRIGPGLVILLGVANGDTEKEAEALAAKSAGLRIFSDPQEKFNLSVLDIHGEILIVSQFTLLADSRKGRRPSFTDAAPPDLARRLYELFCDKVRQTGLKVATGQFQADMLVDIQNDGPVTVMLDTAEWK